MNWEDLIDELFFYYIPENNELSSSTVCQDKQKFNFKENYSLSMFIDNNHPVQFLTP